MPVERVKYSSLQRERAAIKVDYRYTYLVAIVSILCSNRPLRSPFADLRIALHRSRRCSIPGTAPSHDISNAIMRATSNKISTEHQLRKRRAKCYCERISCFRLVAHAALLSCIALQTCDLHNTSSSNVEAREHFPFSSFFGLLAITPAAVGSRTSAASVPCSGLLPC